MAQFGEVSLKVKRAILLDDKFTVAQIADLTGLKYESVETVIRRLLKEGILTKAEKAIPFQPQKGRPRQYYTFTSEEAKQKLKREVEAFLLEETLVHPKREVPKNPHFVYANSLIRAVEKGEKELTDELIKEIHINLKLAREYEEMITPNPEIAFAHIDFLQARFKYLKEEYEEGEKLLKRAKEVFKKYGMIKEEKEIDEFYRTSVLSPILSEIEKAVGEEKYEQVLFKIEKVSSFVEEFINSSEQKQLAKLFNIVKNLSYSVQALKARKEELETQNRWLQSQNLLLSIEQQIAGETNQILRQETQISSFTVTSTFALRITVGAKKPFGFRDKSSLIMPSEKLFEKRLLH